MSLSARPCWENASPCSQSTIAGHDLLRPVSLGRFRQSHPHGASTARPPRFDKADAGEGERPPSPAPHPQNPDQKSVNYVPGLNCQLSARLDTSLNESAPEGRKKPRIPAVIAGRRAGSFAAGALSFPLSVTRGLRPGLQSIVARGWSAPDVTFVIRHVVLLEECDELLLKRMLFVMLLLAGDVLGDGGET